MGTAQEAAVRVPEYPCAGDGKENQPRVSGKEQALLDVLGRWEKGEQTQKWGAKVCVCDVLAVAPGRQPKGDRTSKPVGLRGRGV